MQYYLLTTIAALLIGTLVGLYFGKRRNPNQQKLQQQTLELEKAKQQLSQYQNDVKDHFSQTADLMTKLTQDYQGLYSHLAHSSQQLCRDVPLQQQIEHLQQALPPKETVEPETAAVKAEENSQVAEQPKDYV